MATLRTRYGHYIFVLFLLLFLPCLISASQIGCLPNFHTWCGQCEFRMQVWNMLHAARWKCRTQKIAKNSPSGHYRTSLSGYIFATKAHSNNSKNLLNSNISPTCLHNVVNFGPLAAEICWRVWGTSANFNGSHVFNWQRYCTAL